MKTGSVHVYRDAAGEWRWSLVGSNGRIVADSGEGYATKARALKAFRRALAIGETAREVV